MAKITYVFGDVFTGTIVGEISLYGVNATRKMNSGEFRCSFQFDQTGKDNQVLADATIPGRCYVIMERDGKPIWGGIIRSRTYQSQAKVCQLFCSSFEQYTEYRFVRSNFSRTNYEQMNIVRDLFTQMQADPNSFRVDLPAAAPTLLTKSLSVLATELKTYRQVIDVIADGNNGFDWRINVVRDGGAYVRTLEMGYPLLGSRDATALWFEYPGNIVNYWENETMGEAGTNIFGIGAGEGQSMLLSERIQQDLLNANFPRYDVDVSHKDINNIGILNDMTTQEATIRRAPRPVITAEIKGDLDPIFGSYAVGDACSIVFKDAKHPGLGGFTRATRILGYEYYPPSDDSVEMARLVFEGEDL